MNFISSFLSKEEAEEDVIMFESQKDRVEKNEKNEDSEVAIDVEEEPNAESFDMSDLETLKDINENDYISIQGNPKNLEELQKRIQTFKDAKSLAQLNYMKKNEIGFKNAERYFRKIINFMGFFSNEIIEVEEPELQSEIKKNHLRYVRILTLHYKKLAECLYKGSNKLKEAIAICKIVLKKHSWCQDLQYKKKKESLVLGIIAEIHSYNNDFDHASEYIEKALTQNEGESGILKKIKTKIEQRNNNVQNGTAISGYPGEYTPTVDYKKKKWIEEAKHLIEIKDGDVLGEKILSFESKTKKYEIKADGSSTLLKLFESFHEKCPGIVSIRIVCKDHVVLLSQKQKDVWKLEKLAFIINGVEFRARVE